MRVTDEMVEAAAVAYAACADNPDHGVYMPAFRDAITAALSHAAGQDGEQCRAASGFDLVAAMESWHSALDSAKELAINAPDDRYWKRANDVVAYLMTRAPNADSALSRGVPEGNDSSEGAQCGGFRAKHGEHFDILYQAFTYASATDAKRLDWLAHHGASLRNDCQAEGGGWFVIAPYHTGISSVDGRARFATARAAIDAAMEGNE